MKTEKSLFLIILCNNQLESRCIDIITELFVINELGLISSTKPTP